MNDKIKLIYIVGAGHSGSTLLDAMLDRHPSIVGVGELLRIHRAIERAETCACGEPIEQCPFWSQVFATVDPRASRFAFRTGLDFFRNRPNYIDTHEGQRVEHINPKQYLDYAYALYSRIRTVSGKEIICDSSKDVDRLELLLGDPRFDILVVHLVRDGRGVAYSYEKKKKTRSAYRFMYLWALLNSKTRTVLGRHPQVRVIAMRYDNLVLHPEQELKRVLSAEGLNFDPSLLDFKASPHHHVGSNRRFRAQSDSTLRIDDSWKSGLTPLEKIVFALFFLPFT